VRALRVILSIGGVAAGFSIERGFCLARLLQQLSAATRASFLSSSLAAP
jgi:hypothetical protein